MTITLYCSTFVFLLLCVPYCFVFRLQLLRLMRMLLRSGTGYIFSLTPVHFLAHLLASGHSLMYGKTALSELYITLLLTCTGYGCIKDTIMILWIQVKPPHSP